MKIKFNDIVYESNKRGYALKHLCFEIFKQYLKKNNGLDYTLIQNIFNRRHCTSNAVVLSEGDWQQKTEDTKKRYFDSIAYDDLSLYFVREWGNNGENSQGKDCNNINHMIDFGKEQGFAIEIIDTEGTEYGEIDEVEWEEKLEEIVEDDIFSFQQVGNLTFPHKNLLLKGVPGTGKSHIIEEIINKNLNLKENPINVCRINIHSASSNADLMQGIGINSNGGNIEYKEKQGLIYNHIKKALFAPNQPFVLVLEEIQENSLNELIGDLIYLIEEKKRITVDVSMFEDAKEYEYQAFIEEILEDDENEHYIEIPYLVDTSTAYRKMVLPSNLYIFCTSNYRDDKKVIEDNLLRRFDVVEIYPQTQEVLGEDVFKSEDVSNFLVLLNKKILEKFDTEIHPDRYLVGHANWLDITEDDAEKNRKLFYTALLKVIVEFKEIREVDFNAYTEEIVKEVFIHTELSERVRRYIDACDFKYKSYKEMVEKLQKKIYDFLK